jgi:hypothetical protein
MSNNDGASSQSQRVTRGDGTVWSVGEFETTHRVQPHYPDPVGQQSILPPLSRQTALIRMGNDPGAGPPESDRTKVVVWMVVSQDEPFDRLASNGPDRAYELFAISRAGEGIDDDHALVRHNKAGIWTPF